ncbi:MAG TPA: M28 family metallopeptidase [Acidobacteriaceae bacterium]|nr:M28 family metallopeptidase [Acidobacteriaceae bacterium]
MHGLRLSLSLIFFVCGSSLAYAASQPDYAVAGHPITIGPPDPRIAAALKEVSAERIKANIEALVAFKNRSTISSTETDLPPGTGALAAADWLKAQFEKYSQACGGCLEVKDDSFIEQPLSGQAAYRSRVVKPTPMRNVYAVLRGTDPVAARRMYLVTGHYDSRESDVMNTHDPAPGANDDASGTAVSLEAARVLSRLKFPATLVFVCVAGEEQGLDGSRHLARLAKEEGWQLEGVLNNDIVGGDTTPGDALQDKSVVRVFSEGILPSASIQKIQQMLQLGMDNDTPSRQLAREVLTAGRTYFQPPAKPFKPVMELRLDRFLRGGDHSSFSAEGFPAVRFTEWRENYHHQHQRVRIENGIEYGDLLKFDDFNYIAQVARLNLATLATLAYSPGVPQNVRVLTADLDNNTTLKWDAPAAAGGPVEYQIVWRETTANDWQFTANAQRYGATAETHTATLPVSKDNVFFGVRACIPSGHCSQAVAPIPEH